MLFTCYSSQPRAYWSGPGPWPWHLHTICQNIWKCSFHDGLPLVFSIAVITDLILCYEHCPLFSCWHCYLLNVLACIMNCSALLPTYLSCLLPAHNFANSLQVISWAKSDATRQTSIGFMCGAPVFAVFLELPYISLLFSHLFIFFSMLNSLLSLVVSNITFWTFCAPTLLAQLSTLLHVISLVFWSQILCFKSSYHQFHLQIILLAFVFY